MITTNLKECLGTCLKQATGFWCAVALMNDLGYSFIGEIISKDCKQSYLVGIDLPTSPTTLRKLQNRSLGNDEFKAGIYKSTENYHPKVYLIKMSDEFVAIIGLSNLTNGVLQDNVELNYCITSQDEYFHFYKKVEITYSKQKLPIITELRSNLFVAMSKK